MIESAKALQEQKHLAEKEHTQNEIIRLQNEKLTDEINFKNQELASFTYHLVSKNELIQGINDEITKLEKKYPDHKNLLKDLRNIHRLAEQNINADQDWEKFISNFDQVHSEFFKRLTETYPDLSPSDYKLCTYLRMNLTSKEIASIMNISLRSVETNRYRLRKKMQLDTDTNLVQFLINF
jgi:DNA-binding CsgD family transcriptional regulator